jgi:acetoin utilization protein AcuB
MSMSVARWMKTPVITVKPRDSVAHARAMLQEYRINQLPVVQNERLVGIVTDRDVRGAARTVEIVAFATNLNPVQSDPDNTPIEQIMSTNVLTLRPTETIEKAERLLRKERIGSVPIVENGVLRGILTRSDLLGVLIELCTESSARK